MGEEDRSSDLPLRCYATYALQDLVNSALALVISILMRGIDEALGVIQQFVNQPLLSSL